MARLLEPDADNTDEGRNTMSEMQRPARKQGRNSDHSTAEQTSDQVKLPASHKIYVETNGSTANAAGHNLRIPFREVALTPSKAMDGTIEQNPPVRVYDASGPWTDHSAKHDVRDGLPALRREWIVARGDVEE